MEINIETGKDPTQLDSTALIGDLCYKSQPYMASALDSLPVGDLVGTKEINDLLAEEIDYTRVMNVVREWLDKQSKMPIKAIIFDMGNVIYPNRWDLVKEGLEDMGLDFIEFKQKFYIHWDEYKSGKLNKEEFWSRTLSYLGKSTSPDNVEKISLIHKGLWPDNDKSMIGLIEDLRKNYLLLSLTNICEEHEEKLYEDNMHQYFSKIYMSNRIKMKKPDDEIYLHVLNDNGLKPEECVFVDDKETNIAAAKKLGINAIRFEDQKQLEQRLRDLNVI